MSKRSYSDKLRDPRWQKRRLKILERDGWRCDLCWDTETTLNVHHRYYKGEPWDAPDDALITLCESCHRRESEERKKAEGRLRRLCQEQMWASDLNTLVDLIENLAAGDALMAEYLTALRFHSRDPEMLRAWVGRWHAIRNAEAREKLSP